MNVAYLFSLRHTYFGFQGTSTPFCFYFGETKCINWFYSLSEALLRHRSKLTAISGGHSGRTNGTCSLTASGELHVLMQFPPVSFVFLAALRDFEVRSYRFVVLSRTGRLVSVVDTIVMSPRALIV